MALPKAFIDSSVLIAASLSARGYARDLLKAGTAERLELYASLFVLDETERNLRKKVPHMLVSYEAFRDAELFKIARPSHSQLRDIAVKIALKDAPIVAGAVAAGAQFIATYDRRHLLSQAERIDELYSILVCTPEQVLDALEQWQGMT
jgi:predicted nucleic acid-binding protein